MKTISFEVSEEFDRQMRIVAAQLDLSRSEYIRQVLEEKLTQWTTAHELEHAKQEMASTEGPIDHRLAASLLLPRERANSFVLRF